MNLLTADRAALEALHQELLTKFEACKAKGLKLDMSRGKPSKAQLDLCEGMLTALTKSEELMDGKTDTRNYGGLEGLPRAVCRYAGCPRGVGDGRRQCQPDHDV